MGQRIMVHELCGPRDLDADRHGPRHGDCHDDDSRRSPPPKRRLGGCSDHATCSILQSAWIAFRPSNSHSKPYFAKETRCFVAFETQAGEPGTVEKIESRRVVTLPAGLR